MRTCPQTDQVKENASDRRRDVFQSTEVSKKNDKRLHHLSLKKDKALAFLCDLCREEHIFPSQEAYTNKVYTGQLISWLEHNRESPVRWRMRMRFKEPMEEGHPVPGVPTFLVENVASDPALWW